MKVQRIVTASLLALGLMAFSGVAAAADQVIFLVRHAERADRTGSPPPAGTTMASDPPLSPAGNERATKLASMLAGSDVKHIFTTELQRTRLTAAPLAAKISVQPVVVPGASSDRLVQQILEARGSVLVVGHTNTVPEVIKRLGVTAPISIPESEYDNLFIVVRPASGPPALIRLRY